MTVIYVTIIILIVAITMFLVGKIWLVKYAFKYSPGLGLAVLLVPGVTGYFSFYKLEREGKEFYVAMWLAGIVVALVTCTAFFAPLQHIVSGHAFTEEYAESVDVDILGNKKRKPTVQEPEPAVEEPVKPKVEEPVKAPDADAGTPAADSDAGAAAPAEGDAAAAPAEGDKAPAEGGADKAPEGGADKAAEGGADKAAEGGADKAAEKPADDKAPAKPADGATP